LYGYVGNNPIGYVDLMGTEWKPVVPKTSEEHYARNSLNIDLPQSQEEAIRWWWTLLDESESVFHSFGNPKWKLNPKYIWPKGHKEVVFRYDTWEIDNSPENMWTYNYFNPNGSITDKLNHWRFDILPYYDYWNHKDDDTTYIQRTARSTETTYAVYQWTKEIEYTAQRFNQKAFIFSIINQLSH
jgi:hypothetical protein